MTLIAESGKVYTNGEVYGKTINLGTSDSIENWYQIDETQIPTEEPETELGQYKLFYNNVIKEIPEGEY